MVDSANIQPDEGWSAGTVVIPATMERTDVFGGDVVENWHTSVGWPYGGSDHEGEPIVGTPGMPNSPGIEPWSTLVSGSKIDLDGLLQFSLSALPMSASFPQQVRALVVDEAGNDLPNVASAITWSSDGATALVSIDPVDLPQGSSYVWLGMTDREALLIPIHLLE